MCICVGIGWLVGCWLLNGTTYRGRRGIAATLVKFIVLQIVPPFPAYRRLGKKVMATFFLFSFGNSFSTLSSVATKTPCVKAFSFGHASCDIFLLAFSGEASPKKMSFEKGVFLSYSLSHAKPQKPQKWPEQTVGHVPPLVEGGKKGNRQHLVSQNKILINFEKCSSI